MASGSHHPHMAGPGAQDLRLLLQWERGVHALSHGGAALRALRPAGLGTACQGPWGVPALLGLPVGALKLYCGEGSRAEHYPLGQGQGEAGGALP